MKSRFRKKLLTLLLAAAMLLSLSAGALADGENPTEAQAPVILTKEQGNNWTEKQYFIEGETWDPLGTDLFDGKIFADPENGTLTYTYYREEINYNWPVREAATLNSAAAKAGENLVLKITATSSASGLSTDFLIVYDGEKNDPPVRKADVPAVREGQVEFVVGSRSDFRIDGLTSLFEDPNGREIINVGRKGNARFDKGYFKPSAVGEETGIIYAATDPIGNAESVDTYTVNYIGVQPYSWPKITSIGTAAMKAEAADGTIRDLLPVVSVDIQNQENLEYTNFTTSAYTDGEWKLGTVVITLDGEEPASLDGETPFMDFSNMMCTEGGSPKTARLVYANENNPAKLYLRNSDNFNEYYDVLFQFTEDTTPPVLTLVSGTHNHRDSVQVVFTADEDGTYYFAAAALDAEEPDIDMSGSGTPMHKGENVLNLTDVSMDGLKIYIRAKDENGNSMTESLAAAIPSYEIKYSSFGFRAEDSQHAPGKNYAITRITVDGQERELVSLMGGAIRYNNIEEGSEVHVWLGNLPNVCQRLEDVFLYRASDELNSRVDTVIYDDNSFSFIMPDEDVVGPKAGNTGNVLYEALVNENPRWEYYYLAVADPSLYTQEESTVTLFSMGDFTVESVTAGGSPVAFSGSSTVTIPNLPKDSEVCIRFGGLTEKGVRLMDAVLSPVFDTYSRVETTVNTNDNSITFIMPGTDLRSAVTGNGKILTVLGYTNWLVTEPLTELTITEVSDSAVRRSNAVGEFTLEAGFNGVYYYGFTEDVDTTGEGTLLSQGRNTVTVSPLTGSGAQTVYIIAKDAAGTFSNKLAVTIPAYQGKISSLVLEAVAEPDTVTRITVDGEEAEVSGVDFGDGTIDYSVDAISEGSIVRVYFSPKPGYRLAEAVLEPDVEVTVADDNSFSFVMPGEDVYSPFVEEWGGSWYRLEELPCATVAAASLSLKGQIDVNYKLTFNDAALADTNAYVQFTYKNKTGGKLYIRDATKDVKDGVTRYVFSQPLAAKEMTELVTLKVYDGNGSPMTMQDSNGRELTGAEYSVAHYVKVADTYYPNISPLMHAMACYGAYAMNLFGYTPVNPDTRYADQVVTEPVSGTAADFAGFKASISGEMPSGISIKSISLTLESETSINLYLTVSSGANIGDYTIKADGKTASLIPADGRYRITIPNIAAKDLDKEHVLTINDCEVSFTALNFAYSTLKNFENNPDQEALCNLVRALKAYNDEANSYFGQ